eukprot:3248309-Amphidinium_carterae.1
MSKLQELFERLAPEPILRMLTQIINEETFDEVEAIKNRYHPDNVLEWVGVADLDKIYPTTLKLKQQITQHSSIAGACNASGFDATNKQTKSGSDCVCNALTTYCCVTAQTANHALTQSRGFGPEVKSASPEASHMDGGLFKLYASIP